MSSTRIDLHQTLKSHASIVKIAAVGLAVLFAGTTAAAAGLPTKTEAGHYLSKSQFKEYTTTTKNELGINLKTFVGKKIKFEHVYTTYNSEAGGAAEQIYPINDYLLLRSGLSFGSNYSDSIPMVVSRKSRKMLLDILAKAEDGGSFVVFGKVERCKAPKRSQQQAHGYYSSYPDFAISIEDVFPGTIESLEIDKDDAPVKAGLGKDKAAVVKADDADGDSYLEVDSKNIDLVVNKYVEKKISLNYPYNGRMPQISFYLAKQFSNELYFELARYSRFSGESTSAVAVVAKKSDDIIKFVSKLNSGDVITVRGTLKKTTDSRYSPPQTTFYLLADDFLPATKAVSPKPDGAAPGQRNPPGSRVRPAPQPDTPANENNAAIINNLRRERERQERQKAADDDISSTLDAISGGK